MLCDLSHMPCTLCLVQSQTPEECGLVVNGAAGGGDNDIRAGKGVCVYVCVLVCVCVHVCVCVSVRAHIAVVAKICQRQYVSLSVMYL